MKSIKFTIVYNIAFIVCSFVFALFMFPSQVEACNVIQNPNITKFRTLSPVDDNWYLESNPPTLYIDFRTVNCTPTDSLNLHIYGISDVTFQEILTVFERTITVPINLGQLDNTGGMSLGIKVTERGCFGDNGDVSNNDNDCWIIAVFTNSSNAIVGTIGNFISGVPLAQTQQFIQFFASNQNISLNQSCSGVAGYLYRSHSNCNVAGNGFIMTGIQNVNQKIASYYNSLDSGGGLPQFTVVDSSDPNRSDAALASFYYSCDFVCDENNLWGPVQVSSYEGIIQGDTSSNSVEPISSNYQEEYIPLAPLPFEGLNGGPTPDLGQYLAAIFRMAIVVIAVLAVIMIVFHGIAYATTDVIGGKTDHRKGVWNAILGLVLALGSWLLLNTINPRLASQLRIGIPDVHLDGPDPAWQDGNAPNGTQISSTALLNGQPILQGMPWPDDTPQRNQLASAGISVVSSGNSNCTPTAGTPNCTSVYFDNTAIDVINQMINFKQMCNCEIVVTGGSEAWLHRTHGPNKKIVDFRATTSLNQYLNELPGGPSPSSNFPSGKTINISGVGKFYAESSGSTENTTAHHWHVTFY